MSILDKLSQVEILLKHLPLRHDQQRHAGGDALAMPSGPKRVRDAVEVAIGKLPHDHRALVKNLEITNTNDPYSIGLADSATGNIRIAGRTSVLDFEEYGEAAIHEVGHLVSDLGRFGLGNASLEFSSKAKKFVGDMESAYRGSRKLISTQAAFSVDEYISESYAHYVLKPDILKSGDPLGYSIVRDLFDGQEYT